MAWTHSDRETRVRQYKSGHTDRVSSPLSQSLCIPAGVHSSRRAPYVMGIPLVRERTPQDREPGEGGGGGKAHDARSCPHPSEPEIHLIQVKTALLYTSKIMGREALIRRRHASGHHTPAGSHW